VHRRNNRWLSHDPDDVPVMLRTKLPASARVLGVMSNEGDVMRPLFLQKRVKRSPKKGTLTNFKKSEALGQRSNCWQAAHITTRRCNHLL
jgi:hypothetical protein